MVAVVVEPFVKEVTHGELAHVWVDAGATKLVNAEVAHERDARIPKRGELRAQGYHRAGAVVPFALDRHLIPGDAGGTILLEEGLDPAGKAPALGLDEVTDALLRALLAWRRVPLTS